MAGFGQGFHGLTSVPVTGLVWRPALHDSARMRIGWDYNVAHRCPSPLARNLGPTRSSRLWAQAVWEKSIAPVTTVSTASSRSRSFLLISPLILLASCVLNEKRKRFPH